MTRVLTLGCLVVVLIASLLAACGGGGDGGGGGGAGLPSFAAAALEGYPKASNTGAGDQFGSSVALAGDTLAVSADDEDSNATGVNGNQADNRAPTSGAAYVYRAR